MSRACHVSSREQNMMYADRSVMSMQFAAAAIVAALATTLSAQVKRPSSSKAPAGGRAEMTVPFTVGETLTYDVSWESFVTAGTATLTVREKKPSYGSVAYYVAAEGGPTPFLSRLYKLYYKADSLVDVYSLLPQRGSVFSQEGRRQRSRITMFDQARHRAHYEVQTRTIVKKDMPIPPRTQDALSAIYALRTFKLRAGDSFSIPVCDDGESFQVQVSVAAPEQVRTGIGEIRAWRLTPTLPAGSETRRLLLWISDDQRRLPVKMEAELLVGTFDLTLRTSNR